MLRALLLLVATTLALSLSALGEIAEWRCKTHPLILPYDTALWSITPERPKVLPAVFFALKHRDQKTRVCIRLLDLAVGEKLDETGIAAFAEGFRRTSRSNVTIEWTQKDFTTDAGCEYKVVQTSGETNQFLVGRLTSHDGIMYDIAAQGIGSSPEAQASAVKVMRALKFDPGVPLSGRFREWKSPQYPMVLPYDTNVWAITDSRPQGLDHILVAIAHRDGKTGIFIKITPLKPTDQWNDTLLDDFATALSGGRKSALEWVHKDFQGRQGCEFKLTPPNRPEIRLAGRLCMQTGGVFLQVIAHGRDSSPEAWQQALDVVHAFQNRDGE